MLCHILIVLIIFSGVFKIRSMSFSFLPANFIYNYLLSSKTSQLPISNCTCFKNRAGMRPKWNECFSMVKLNLFPTSNKRLLAVFFNLDTTHSWNKPTWGRNFLFLRFLAFSVFDHIKVFMLQNKTEQVNLCRALMPMGFMLKLGGSVRFFTLL